MEGDESAADAREEPRPAQPILIPIGLDTRSLALGVLAVLALFYTLQFAASLFIPIVLALLGRFALSPVVRRMRRVGIPAPLGAALIVLGIASGVFLGARSLATPAAEWVERAPQTLRQVERKIRFIQRPVVQVVEATEGVAEAAAGGDEQQKSVVVQEGPSLLGAVIDRAQRLFGLLIVTATLLVFMLASGDGFANRLAPSARVSDSWRDEQIFERIESDISRHLLTITLVNTALGAVVALAMWALGMPSPMLWGVLAGVLNYMPFVGAFLTAVILGGVSLITFDDPLRTFAVVSVFVTLTGLEGMLLTPALLGRRLMLSATAVLLSVLVWSWLWGLIGAILAVPLLSAFRILCEHVEPLAPIGALIGREPAADAR